MLHYIQRKYLAHNLDLDKIFIPTNWEGKDKKHLQNILHEEKGEKRTLKKRNSENGRTKSLEQEAKYLD